MQISMNEIIRSETSTRSELRVWDALYSGDVNLRLSNGSRASSMRGMTLDPRTAVIKMKSGELTLVHPDGGEYRVFGHDMYKTDGVVLLAWTGVAVMSESHVSTTPNEYSDGDGGYVQVSARYAGEKFFVPSVKIGTTIDPELFICSFMPKANEYITKNYRNLR